jgi:hypothetical protein
MQRHGTGIINLDVKIFHTDNLSIGGGII